MSRQEYIAHQLQNLQELMDAEPDYEKYKALLIKYLWLYIELEMQEILRERGLELN